VPACPSACLPVFLPMSPTHMQAYDSMGHSAYENMEAGGGAPGGQGPFPGAGMQVDPEDLLREFFGGGGGGGYQVGCGRGELLGCADCWGAGAGLLWRWGRLVLGALGGAQTHTALKGVH
jgi:hypothetical protein